MGRATSNIKFSVSEINALEGWPQALRALADYHDYQETMAAAMDDQVFGSQIAYHQHRRKELIAEADRIQKEWEA